MVTSRFRVHGQYEITCRGRVLTVDAEGPWNEDAAHQYRADLTEAIESLAPEPWGQVIIVHGEAVLTPEAEAQLVEITRWRIERGLSRIAMVLDGVVNRALVETQFGSVYERTALRHAFFDAESDALDWLAEAGLPWKDTE